MFDRYPYFILEGICAIADTNPEGSTTPSKPNLLPIGTKVRSDMKGRATGEIVGYNTNPSQAWYNAERYPYVILWADGYRDYYEDFECFDPNHISVVQ